jgi:hypothetical protein
MKFAVAILFFVGLFGLSGGQENPPTNQAPPPSVGLTIGQLAPAFALSDQFGHDNPTRPSKVRRALSFFFSVRPIGDPSAKRSSCSCKTQNKDLRHKG